MPNICAVFGCNSRGRRKEGLSFFRFPKDAETRQKWINLCRRKDKFNYPNSRICSRHFEDSSYLIVTGTKRMNVRKAVQLLSETTSKAIDFYGKQGLLESKHWESTRDFIWLADAWFD